MLLNLRKNIITSKLSHPLMLSVFIFLVIPLAIFLSSALSTRELEIEKVRLDTSRLARAIEQHAHDIFNSADNSILEFSKLMVETKALQKIGSKEISIILNQIAERQQHTELILVTDIEGNYLASSAWAKDFDVQSKAGKSVGQRAYFKQLRDNPDAGLIVSEPVHSNTTGNLVVVLSRRIPDPENKFRGVILITINVREMSNFFANIARNPGDAISLWNEKRILLARYPYTEEQIGKYAPVNPAMAPLLDRGDSFGTYEGDSTVDKVHRIFSFYKVEKYPLTVIVGTNKEEALAGWRRSVLFTGVSGTLLAIVGIFLFLQYIKTQRRSEADKAIVIQASKMASLGEMASGIAHEINNPLAIIAGKASQISKMIETGRYDLNNLKVMAEKIESTAMRIAKIIAGLRSFARDSDRDPMAIVALSRILENTLEMSRQRFESHGVRLEVKISADPAIHCREAQICQVLLNLLNNAFDAVQTLPEKWVEVEIAELKDSVRIMVTDSGSGIPHEVAEKMMAPFFTTKPVGSGTGLGLSISMGIIAEHRGKLWLDTKHKNTRFVIELPSAARAEKVFKGEKLGIAS